MSFRVRIVREVGLGPVVPAALCVPRPLVVALQVGDTSDLVPEVVELGPATGNEIIVDVSASTSFRIKLRGPGPVSKTIDVALAFVTDGTDGKGVYQLLATDIDVAGFWELQVSVTLPGPRPFRSEVRQLEVCANL